MLFNRDSGISAQIDVPQLSNFRYQDSVLDPDLPHPKHSDLTDLTHSERVFIRGFLDGHMSPDIGLSLTPHDGVEPWLADQANASQWLS